MLAIIDFGSQTAHLIGRRLRQLGVTVTYVNPEDALAFVKEKIKQARGTSDTRDVLKGIILSGSPASVYEEGAPTVTKELFKQGLPILGICYGCQLIAHVLGGTVKPSQKEYGPEEITFTNPTSIFAVPKKKLSVIMSHGVTVTKIPPGYITMGKTKSVEYAAIANEKEKIYGVQFHPEAHHTEYGLEILRNFARKCNEEMQPISLDPQKLVTDIQETVKDKKVICAVSGGVDSTVAAFLIGKAIGKNLIPVYVESGLMRPDTDKLVKYIFSDLVKAELLIINARERFLTALKEVTEPEKKRKIIGKLYIDIFQEVSQKHPEATFLGQGTIYSDVIESKGSKHASHIKSHHNVGGLPKKMHLKLIEPMRQFYKDEVREIGRLAGLPEEVVMQQPFPGPGYAVRIRGKITEKRLAQVKQADMIVLDEMKNADLYEKLFQCFAVMSGAYSTAVKGDARVFAEVVAIRAYESVDVMTSQWADLPHEVLAKISSRIVNEVPHISRVVYDITTKPPATMEWE